MTVLEGFQVAFFQVLQAKRRDLKTVLVLMLTCNILKNLGALHLCSFIDGPHTFEHPLYVVDGSTLYTRLIFECTKRIVLPEEGSLFRIYQKVPVLFHRLSEKEEKTVRYFE